MRRCFHPIACWSAARASKPIGTTMAVSAVLYKTECKPDRNSSTTGRGVSCSSRWVLAAVMVSFRHCSLEVAGH